MSETKIGTGLTSRRGYWDMSTAIVGCPNTLGETEMQEETSHLTFPPEIFAYIAEAALASPETCLATVSALSKTSRDIRYATLPAMYSVVRWPVHVPAAQIIREEGWKKLVVSPGFKFARVLVLATTYTHAYSLKLVSQFLSVQPELSHVRALVIKDAESLVPPGGRRRSFGFENIRFGRRYSPGTGHVLDVWAAINEGNVGQRAVINIYLPLQITARNPEDAAGRLVPFSPLRDESTVLLDSVTLDLYHEDQDTEAYESWTRGAVMDTLGLVAYSWRFWGDLCLVSSAGVELPKVDIIGVQVEMARRSVEAFACAISENSAFAFVVLHVSLEDSELSAANVHAILGPLRECYSVACNQLWRQESLRKLGSVKISLVTGEEKALVESGRVRGAEVDCEVLLWDEYGRRSSRTPLREYLGATPPRSENGIAGDGKMLQLGTEMKMLGI